jgi:hypothetical protein
MLLSVPAPSQSHPSSLPTELHPRFGQLLHSSEPSASSASPAPAKVSATRVLIAIVSVAMIPMGLGWVRGALGARIALVGVVCAALCVYALVVRFWRSLNATSIGLDRSSRSSRTAGIVIDLYERGIVCRHRKAKRELMWNEVVDITSEFVAVGPQRSSLNLALEVVGELPLVIVLRLDTSQTAVALHDALHDTWLRIWCRRARACLHHENALTLGVAELSCEGVRIADRTLPWAAVRGAFRVDREPTKVLGVEGDDGTDLLETSSGRFALPIRGHCQPFPSIACRIAALAAEQSSLLQSPTQDPGRQEPGTEP